LADKNTQLIVDALGKAVVQPAGLPLFGTKAAPGLFPSTAAGRFAADSALADGLICVHGRDPKGKSDRDLHMATDAGRETYLRETRPKQVLEDLTRAIEKRHAQVDELLKLARDAQGDVTALKSLLSSFVPAFEPPSPKPTPNDDARWLADVRPRLNERIAAGDCPLPELYRRLHTAHPKLTVGRFHDGLRDLHEREKVYLHPWTGPLYALPEPAFALLVGHEVAYYASPREGATPAQGHESNGIVSRRVVEA
jgi:hypothetical protein